MIALDSTTIRVRMRTRRMLKIMSVENDERAIDIVERLVAEEFKRFKEEEDRYGLRETKLYTVTEPTLG